MNNTDEQFEYLDNYPITFGKYDGWDSLWQTDGGQTDTMLRCGKAPRYLYNTKTGKRFIGKYWCYSRPCRDCGSRGRNRIGNIIYPILAKAVCDGQALYYDVCRGSEWARRRDQVADLKANGYKIVHDGTVGRKRSPLQWQIIHAIATEDFSLRQYGRYAAFECERVDTFDALEEVLQRASAMPPRIFIRPLGKFPKIIRPPSDWKTISNSHLLTTDELEAIEEKVCPQGLERLSLEEFAAHIALIEQRIQAEVERRKAKSEVNPYQALL